MALSLLAALALGQVAAQTLRVNSDIPSQLEAGKSGSLTLEIVLDDPQGVVEEGVLFLNIVINSRERNWPQAGHLVFSGAAEEPAVFRRVLSGEELRNGVVTSLDFDVRRRAPFDEFSLVLQVFAGNETNPHRVRQEHKVGQVGFPFRVVPEVTGER